MKTIDGLACCVGVVLVTAAAREAGAQMYTPTDLGTLPGYTHSKAFGINESGQVAGSATNDLSLGPDRPFVWQGGPMTDLGTLGGDGGEARAVNGLGAVVGSADIEPGPGAPFHGFVWQDESMEDLDTLGGSSSWASDINDSGVIVGGARVTGDSVFLPTVWVAGVPDALGLLEDHWVGAARAVNASGVVVGYSTSLFAEPRAVIWDSTPQDLGTLPGGCCSEAFDVNDANQVVGFSWLDGATTYHATRWNGGPAMDLGTLPGGSRSRAHAINNEGLVVGMSWTSTEFPGDPHACLWQDGETIDLNDRLVEPSLWRLVEAWDINEAGSIAAVAVHIEEDVTHAVLLTPIGAVPGDHDGDGDVDLDDYAEFAPCMTGPGIDFGAGCAVFDFDADDDVDVADFAGFQRAMTGGLGPSGG